MKLVECQSKAMFCVCVCVCERERERERGYQCQELRVCLNTVCFAEIEKPIIESTIDKGKS